MNTSKTITLTVSAIIAIAIMLLIIQLLLRKLKIKSEQEGRLKLSYGVWFTTLFVAATITATKAISILSEAIDNVYKNVENNIIGEVAKTASLFIGLSGKSMYIDPLSPVDHDLASPNFNDPSSPYPFNPKKYSNSNSCANLTKTKL